MTIHEENRRPLKTRQYLWAHRLARFFVRRGISPNQMSMASIGMAVIGAVAYTIAYVIPGLHTVCLILAATAVQLRLLVNMLDGLMAVEEGQKTATGVLYNELPDRAADVVFLVAAGHASGWPLLGWLAALLAVSTAYIRAFGGALGYTQDFSGPMAKPQRMFALTLGSLIAAVFPSQPVLALTLVVIIVGCVVTIARRVRHIAARLTQNGHD